MSDVATTLRATAKPPRLRAACNQCHIAKARCSGEKHGCLRCSTYNLKCEYLVSMVGRTPKRRRSRGDQHAAIFLSKERPPTSPSAVWEPSQLEIHQTAPASTLRTRLDNSGGGANMSATGWRPPAASVSGDACETFQIPDNGDPDLASLILQPPKDVASTSATTTELTISGVHHLDGYDNTSGACLHLTCIENNCISSLDDFSFPGLASEQAPPFSTIRGRDPVSAQLDPLARSSRMVPTGYRDTNAVARYPHAAMLMNIIDGLESCLQQTAPVDQVLNMNRMAMAKLPSIMEMEGFKACNSCPVLVGTILDLVIGMYSMALPLGQTPPEEKEVSVAGAAEPGGGLRSEPYLPVQSTSPTAVPNVGNQTTSTLETLNAVSQPIFAFGCLELEPEDHIILLNVLFKRDLRRCIKTVQSHRREMQERWEAAQHNLHSMGRTSSLVSNSRAQDLWYGEMEDKVEELLAAINDISPLGD